MPRPPQDVTDTELAVLEVLWGRGSATRRQVTDALYPAGGPAHYTTVQKLLERLEAKGHVLKDRDEGVLVFRATVDRQELLNRRLRDVAEKLGGGSLTPLLMNLLRTQSLSEQEIQELRQLIRDQGQPKRKGDSR